MADFILGVQIPCAHNLYNAVQINLKHPLESFCLKDISALYILEYALQT